jgi:hypothetical protein
MAVRAGQCAGSALSDLVLNKASIAGGIAGIAAQSAVQKITDTIVAEIGDPLKIRKFT